MTEPITRADVAVTDGLQLVGIVRDFGADSIETFLREQDRAHLEALAVALAAMVPIDRSVTELLAWCDPDAQRREQQRRREILRRAERKLVVKLPHGTHAAFNGHKQRGELPCEVCRAGERIYQRDRARMRRAKEKAS